MTSAYQQQLARRVRERDDQLRDAEDELGTLRRERADLIERTQRAEAALALLHQGEEPYNDERLVPTPAQWIWKWNQCTPAERLERAEQVIADRDRVTRCILAHSALFARAEQAEGRIAAVRELHQPDGRQLGTRNDGTYGLVDPVCAACGTEGMATQWPCLTIAALDATAEARP